MTSPASPPQPEAAEDPLALLVLLGRVKPVEDTDVPILLRHASGAVDALVMGGLRGVRGISGMSDVHVLRRVSGAGCPVQGVAECLRVSHQAASKTVARLEQAGLVTKGWAGRDGRRILVQITSDGREVVAQAEHSIGEAMDELGDLIGDLRFDTLVVALQILAHNERAGDPW